MMSGLCGKLIHYLYDVVQYFMLHLITTRHNSGDGGSECQRCRVHLGQVRQKTGLGLYITY